MDLGPERSGFLIWNFVSRSGPCSKIWRNKISVNTKKLFYHEKIFKYQISKLGVKLTDFLNFSIAACRIRIRSGPKIGNWSGSEMFLFQMEFGWELVRYLVTPLVEIRRWNYQGFVSNNNFIILTNCRVLMKSFLWIVIKFVLFMTVGNKKTDGQSQIFKNIETIGTVQKQFLRIRFQGKNRYKFV